jgi:hypothetical protein
MYCDLHHSLVSIENRITAISIREDDLLLTEENWFLVATNAAEKRNEIESRGKHVQHLEGKEMLILFWLGGPFSDHPASRARGRIMRIGKPDAAH